MGVFSSANIFPNFLFTSYKVIKIELNLTSALMLILVCGINFENAKNAKLRKVSFYYLFRKVHKAVCTPFSVP